MSFSKTRVSFVRFYKIPYLKFDFKYIHHEVVSEAETLSFVSCAVAKGKSSFLSFSNLMGSTIEKAFLGQRIQKRLEKYENITFRRIRRTKESNDNGIAAHKESHLHCLNYDLMFGFIFTVTKKLYKIITN